MIQKLLTNAVAVHAIIVSALPSVSPFPTRYTIDDDTCAPLTGAELRTIIERSCDSLDTYLQKRPIATHTRAAFQQALHLIDTSRPIVLDSGCGTGRSTLLLGNKFPNHMVIGVDRSFVRLNRIGIAKSDEPFQSCLGMESRRPFQALSENVLLIRAELTDFWRCCIDSNWNVDQHFILYPNPYPKKNRLKKRFYAHPSFPLILQLGGDITLRSNWHGYLREFASSVIYAHDFYDQKGDAAPDKQAANVALPYLKDAMRGPVERLDKSVAWTNFEQKYDNVGEGTYELVLRRVRT